jgi:transposase-like protein
MRGYVYKETGQRAIRSQRYRCPDCAGEFVHSFLSSESKYPERCPLCNAWVSGDSPPDEVFVPATPLIRENAYARSIDQVYRAEEKASADRAEDAVAHLEAIFRDQPKIDGPEGEAVAHAQKLELAGLKSGLKITDMRDPTSMREGDMAAIAPTPAPLTQGGLTAQFQNPAGIPNFTPGVPGVGDALREGIVSGHATRAQAMTAQGQLGPTFIDRR